MYVIHHKLKYNIVFNGIAFKYGSLNCQVVLKTDIEKKNPPIVVEHTHYTCNG